MFLRKQLALYLEREVQPRRATDATRLSLVLLSRLFAWQDALVNLNPETFLGAGNHCAPSQKPYNRTPSERRIL